MITGAIARYDVKEVVRMLKNDCPSINRNELRDWFAIMLMDYYGLNVLFPITPQYKDKLITLSEWANKVVFAHIKPPVFDYDQMPNFVCEVTLRPDDILTLHYS